MNDLSLVVVPTYNERENLVPLAEAVFSHLPKADLLFVDDGSPDGTGEVAERLSRENPRITVLHRPRKEGLGTAYVTGFRYGLAKGYSTFFEMDADFSHDARYLPTMLERVRAGADLVLGSRYVDGGGTENWGVGRKLVSRGGSIYARTILGVKIQDLTGGFKCFRRSVLETVNLSRVRSEGYSFQIEMTYRAIKKGFKVEEIPIVFVDRRVGQSKMSRAIFLEAIWIVWRLRFGLDRG
jgi:dolichol-phosphate mannosyltransferase